MGDALASSATSLPVLLACGVCGNIDDLALVLGSSAGLTGLLALGQYTLDRLRRRLRPRGGIRTLAAEELVCVRDIRTPAEAVRTTVPPSDPA
jgi:hypothetical protein